MTIAEIVKIDFKGLKIRFEAILLFAKFIWTKKLADLNKYTPLKDEIQPYLFTNTIYRNLNLNSYIKKITSKMLGPITAVRLRLSKNR